jgi:hypothetical protein
LFVDFNLLQLDGFSGIVEINVTAAGSATRFLIWESTSPNQLQANFGSMASAINKNGITVGRHKAAITYGPSFFKFFVDGVKIGESVPVLAPSGLSGFSFENGAGSVNFQKKEILQSLIFKTELTERPTGRTNNDLRCNTLESMDSPTLRLGTRQRPRLKSPQQTPKAKRSNLGIPPLWMWSMRLDTYVSNGE